MSNTASNGQANVTGERRFTGRMALVLLIGFFGFVTLVNIVMIRAAVTTFGGVDTPSSYQAGLAFTADEAAAKAQARRDWNVTAEIGSNAQGALISIDVQDGAGQAVTGAEVEAHLAHPIDERKDVILAIREVGSGKYAGRAEAVAGQWKLDIEVSKRGERLFRSQNRVSIE
jgi:nitrogen fixation protein FixH